MQKFYDISVPISSKLPVWPGDPHPHIERVNKLEEGAEANVTHIQMSAHTGTHIDAPYHFNQQGFKIDEINLGVLIGDAMVYRIPDERDVIDRAFLTSLKGFPGASRVLFKTANSKLWETEKPFQKDYVAISEDGARLLVEKQVLLVGLDYLSVAPFDDTTSTHRILLDAGIVLLEGLDLSLIDAGSYDLYCLPLKIAGADGAPARAVLREK